MSAANRMYRGVLTILTIPSVSSIYVRTGSNITDCSMKCPHRDGGTHLYKLCGDNDTLLLDLWCDNLRSANHFGPRLHVDTSSGCWTLTDAGKNDSCIYTAWYHSGSGGSDKKTINITVLDPVLISTITSNSSRLGQDITVRVQFSGEETAVTWEVDGQPLPDRYRLIDDNRTLLIPSAQIDDDRRRLSVRITNPVSEETREYQLEITNHGLSPGAVGAAAAAAGIVLVLVISCFTFTVKIVPEERRRRISYSSGSTQYGEDGTSQNMINSQRDEELQMEASLKLPQISRDNEETQDSSP